MKKYCIIPARSGSKGLPNKNILFLDGKPLIRHTIDAAINSAEFDVENIYLSTDSLHYFELVGDSNISLHRRGEELSNDKAPSSAFMIDFLNKMVPEEDAIVVLCQPTSPLRYGFHIQEAVELFENNECDTLVSVTKLDKSPRLFSTLPNGRLTDLHGVDKNYRRQDEVTVDNYYPNGAIFVTTKKYYLENITFYAENTIPYIMDSKSSVDVDGLVDFHAAVGIREQDYRNKLEETLQIQESILNNVSVSESKIIVGDSQLVSLNLDNKYAFSGFMLRSFYDFFGKLKNKEVHIMLGVNDFQYGAKAEDVISYFERAFEILLNNNCDVYVYEIFNTLNRPLLNNLEIEKVNNFLGKFDTIRFVKTNHLLSNVHGLKLEYTNDGLHLNEEGNKILLKIISEEYCK